MALAGMIGSIPRRTNRARAALLSYPRSAISRSGRLRGRPGRCGRVTAIVSSVASRSRTSAGDAESRYAPNGVPAPSTNTIHFVPLPRLVGPTLAPPFSPARSSHRGSTRSSAVSARHSSGPARPATASARPRWLPTAAAVANRCSGCHTAWAVRSTVRRSTESRVSLRSSAERRQAVGRPSVGAGPGVNGDESGPIAHRSAGATPCVLLSLKAVMARILLLFRGFEITSGLKARRWQGRKERYGRPRSGTAYAPGIAGKAGTVTSNSW